MKLFLTQEEMESIPKIRKLKQVHTTDQIVAQAARLGWTVGITNEDLAGAQCGAVIGLHLQDNQWLSGKDFTGVWYKQVKVHMNIRKLWKWFLQAGMRQWQFHRLFRGA